MKLNIGGEQKKEGWKILNIQKKDGVDFIGDISDLSQFSENSVEEIYASHVVEHVEQSKIESTFEGIHRILKDNGKFYVHVNGTYLTSGDPTSGSTGTGSLGDISVGSRIYVPFITNSNYSQTNDIEFNFGNGYFGTTQVSSAGTNASNNGIFEYDVPAGYTALSTKGLNL